MNIFDSAHEHRLESIIRNELLPKVEQLAGSVSERFIESLIDNSHLVQAFKGDVIDEAGSDQDRSLLYLNTGIAHTFYFDTTSGGPLITRIWKKRDIIFDLNYFLNCHERRESTQMLEDGELLSIGYDHLKEMMDTYPNVGSFLLHLQAERERQYKYYQHLLRLTVKDRVRIFLNDNPTMINRINNEYIALHLGISRSRFSKAYAEYKKSLS